MEREWGFLKKHLYLSANFGYTVAMLPYKKQNKRFARENRKARNATPQEGILWHTYLKSCPVNFARQYRVENYILDFYAPSIKLAIEVDGGQHYEDKGMAYDVDRTRVLEALGITVLRFTNLDIDKRLKETTDYIAYHIEQLKGDRID